MGRSGHCTPIYLLASRLPHGRSLTAIPRGRDSRELCRPFGACGCSDSRLSEHYRGLKYCRPFEAYGCSESRLSEHYRGLKYCRPFGASIACAARFCPMRQKNQKPLEGTPSDFYNCHRMFVGE